MFRFRNRDKPRDLGAIHESGIEPRIAQVFAPLLATVESETTKQRMVALAHEYSRQLFAERSMSLEAQLLEIIQELRGDHQVIAVKNVSDRFAERHGPEYRHPVTPRWIGGLLRSRLSLTPVRSHGNFVIPRSDDQKIDQLLKRFGVREAAEDEGVPNVPSRDTVP
jgi:hypothetical protein